MNDLVDQYNNFFRRYGLRIGGFSKSDPTNRKIIVMVARGRSNEKRTIITGMDFVYLTPLGWEDLFDQCKKLVKKRKPNWRGL